MCHTIEPTQSRYVELPMSSGIFSVLEPDYLGLKVFLVQNNKLNPKA